MASPSENGIRQGILEVMTDRALDPNTQVGRSS